MSLLDAIIHSIGYTKLPTKTPQQPELLQKSDREGLAQNPLEQVYMGIQSQYGLRKSTNITLQTLRRMSVTNWVDRTCISTLRDEITGIPWDIAPMNPKEPWDKKFQQYVKELLMRPNRNNENWRTLIDKVVEDILVVDAGTIEKVRNKDGMLVELWHLDGATIRPVFDEHGVVGNPAYEQYLPGQREPKPVAQWANDDVIYIMWNPQGAVDSFGFGMSPVEAGLAVGTAFLYAEAYNLNFFKNNSIPAMIINMGKEVPPQEVDKFRAFLAAEMMGTQGFHQPVVTSFNDGFSVEPLLSKPSDMAWEKYVEWQMKWKVALYRMSPQDIGFNVDMYKVEGEVQQQLSQNKAINSLKGVLKHYIDTEIIGDLSFRRYNNNLQFQWIDTDVVDPVDQATVDGIYLKAGKTSINELRQRDGQDPIIGGSAPTMIVGSQLVKIDPTPMIEDEQGNLQPVEKALLEKVFDKKEGTIIPMSTNDSAICWMDDRGVTQPLFITDPDKTSGFQVKPAFLDDKKGQEPPEQEVSEILRAMKVNTPEVKIMNYDDVLKLIPHTLYPEITKWVNVQAPFDSAEWRQRWGNTRKSNYYIVTGYISGADLGNHELQKQMAVSPESYGNAVRDLANVWVAERLFFLGDRKPGHYIITNQGNGFGVDYQFYKDKNSYLKTRHFLPRSLMLINPKLKEMFDGEVERAVKELGHDDMLDSTEKSYRKLLPHDWERMEGFEDIEKLMAKSLQRGIYNWYKKAVSVKSPSAAIRVMRKASVFNPDEDYISTGIWVWQNGVRYPVSVLKPGQAPSQSDIAVNAGDYRDGFDYGAAQARVMIEPNLPEGITVRNIKLYEPMFQQRGKLIAGTIDKTMSQAVENIIVNGMDAGETYGMIADKIQASLGVSVDDPTMPQWRAMRIARTEAQFAISEGMRQQYQETGINYLNLSPAADACDLCIAVAKDNPYTVEEAKGLVPIHPNCRCVLIGDYSQFK